MIENFKKYIPIVKCINILKNKIESINIINIHKYT